jgi:glycosyltransferase involved in cell wall biosynthesis
MNHLQPQEVTFIIPVFNTPPDQLKQAVGSCTSQGAYVILCDDGSDDPETISALQQVAAWQGVDLVCHKENSGTSSALSTAAQMVQTPYTMKIDSDDRVVALPSWEGNPNPDAILTRLDPQGKWGNWETPTSLQEFVQRPGPFLNGLCLRVDVAARLFIPLPMDAADDITLALMFFMRAIREGWRIETNAEPVYHQRLDTGSKGDKDWTVFPNARDRLHACAGQAIALLGEVDDFDQEALFNWIREAHDGSSCYPYYC